MPLLVLVLGSIMCTGSATGFHCPKQGSTVHRLLVVVEIVLILAQLSLLIILIQVVIGGGVVAIGRVVAKQADVDAQNQILQKQTNRFEEQEEEENTHQGLFASSRLHHHLIRTRNYPRRTIKIRHRTFSFLELSKVRCDFVFNSLTATALFTHNYCDHRDKRNNCATSTASLQTRPTDNLIPPRRVVVGPEGNGECSRSSGACVAEKRPTRNIIP